MPSVFRSIDDVKVIDEGPLEPRSYNCIATRLFGAARMGADARRGVVDSSVFPTNVGVNPQHSIMALIMALSRLASARLADKLLDTRVRAA